MSQKFTFIKRLLVIPSLCVAWTTGQAQEVHYKIGVDTNYMSRFTVQEASDHNIHPIGLRLLASGYDYIPFEFGMHAYTGYGKVASVSFGLSLAYAFANVKTNHFKMGLSLGHIYLNDVYVNKNELGPHVGDVTFTSKGTQFKPYIEWEWNYSHFTSLFVHTGYRIINGDKSVVTAAKGEGLSKRITKRDDSFFYSGSGFQFGAGISVDFRLGK